VSGSSAVWRTVWEYGLLPRRVRGSGCHLLHGLGNLSPSAPPAPFVLTVHDVSYRHFPESQPLGHRWFMRLRSPGVARRADRVIVPSRNTAREVMEHFGVSEQRLRLVHYGPGNAFRPVTDADRLEEVMGRYGLSGTPYVISVCRGYVHKNLAGLLRAFARLRGRGDDRVRLVLVGERYQSGHGLDRLARELGVSESVVFPGFVSQDDLNALYSGATVFAFPSLSEGFGLPVLEAMACGVPVVASGASAVPEAVGDAGLVADARDPEAFAAALARVLEEPKLRDELRARGLARVKEFSWQRCAAETLAVYRELAV
jgi:glycosyltransferase involved in cell wall biosynthesis